jgi:Protein of unknown function (DUF5818)
MRKLLLLTIILLVSVAWVVAQGPQTATPSGSSTSQGTGSGNDQMASPGSSNQGTNGTDQQSGGVGQGSSPTGQGTGMGQSTSGMSNSGNETQVEGCLNGSAGNYTLTDASGTTWQLQGDTAQLDKHIGQQVRITGTSSAGSNAMGSSSDNTSSAGAGQTFNVTKVHKISSTCSTASSNKTTR